MYKRLFCDTFLYIVNQKLTFYTILFTYDFHFIFLKLLISAHFPHIEFNFIPSNNILKYLEKLLKWNLFL